MQENKLNRTECEKAIIGSSIVNNEWISLAEKCLEDGDFVDANTRTLFTLLKKLNEEGRRWDSTIIKEHLKTLPTPINSAFIDECIKCVSDSDITPEYVREVKEAAISKKFIETSKKLIAMSQEESIRSVLSDSVDQINKLREALPTEDSFNLADTIHKIMDEIEESRKSHKIIKTGFDSFDKFWGGLKPRRLYCVGARPGIGKTSWLLALTANLIKQGYKVLFFSLEMSTIEVMTRLFCIIGGIEARRFEIPSLLTDDDVKRMTETAEKIASRKLTIIDSSCNLADIETITKKERPDVVIVDFIQHMKFPDMKNSDRFSLMLSNTVKQLKFLAKQTSSSIFFASQISRKSVDGGGAANRKPRMDDLKESGGLEENADFVAFLHWPWKMAGSPNDWDEDRKGIVEFIVDKCRFGSVGSIKLLFDYKHTHYKNLIEFKDGEGPPPE